VAKLLTLFLAGEASEMKRRLRTALIAYVIGGLAALMAFIFFLVAAFIAAAFRWGAVEAAVGFAIGFAVIAIVVLGVYQLTAQARRRELERRRAANASMAASASAMTAIPALLGKKGLGANVALLVLAGLGGFAAYRQFEQRNKDHG